MAAKKVGTLSMFVTANTASFQKKMAAAGKTTLDFGKKMGAVSVQAAKFGGAMATGAAAGLAAWTKLGMDAVGTTALVAERIGSTTEKVSALEFAMASTGGSVDRIQEGLTEMVQRLGEAKAGTGSMADGLKMINLQAKDLQKLDPADAFLKIADGINALPPADQVFAIDEMFGGDGREMINLIQLGSEGINKLTLEAKELGLTLDNVGAAKVVKANAQFTKLKGVLRGVGQTLAVEVSPAIIAGTNHVLKMVKDSGGIRTVVMKGFRMASQAVAFFADSFKWVEAGFYSIRAVANAQMLLVVGAIDSGVQAANSLAKALGSDVVDGAARFTGTLKKELGKLVKEDIKNVEKALSDAFTGAAGKQVLSTFEKINRQADKLVAGAGSKTSLKATSAEEPAIEKEKKVQNKVKELLEQRLKDLRKFTMTKQQIEIADLRASGATEAEVESLKALQKTESLLKKQQKEQDQLNKLKERALRLVKGARTEEERFKDDLLEINSLREKGLLTTEQAQKLAQNAFDSAAPEVEEIGAGKQAAIVDTRNVSIEALRAVNSQDIDKKAQATRQNMLEVLKEMLDKLNPTPVLG